MTQPPYQPGPPERPGAPTESPVPPAPVAYEAPAAPAQWIAPVETEPLEYHRLYRGAQKYAWWRPLVAAIIAAAIYFPLNFAVSLLFIPLLMVFDPAYVQSALFDQTSPILDTQHPWSIVMATVLIALMIPSVLLAMLSMGLRPIGRLWSVAGRIRWSLVWRSLGIAAVALVVQFAVNIAIGLATTGFSGADLEPVDRGDFDAVAAVVSFGLVLLLVPFQAAAEEVVFRGMFLQVLGSWLRSPWIAIVLSTIAFSAGHIYDIWGLIGVGMLGLTAAWLTWRTGGLEAGISLHVLNNVLAFGVMATGVGGETGQVEESGGPESLIGQAVALALFAWLVVRMFDKRGYGRQRIDVVMRPVPAPAQAVLPQAQWPQAQYPQYPQHPSPEDGRP